MIGDTMGWAERANKRARSKYGSITAEECASLGRAARQVLATLGVTLDGGADLEQMIRGVEFLGSFNGDPFGPGGAVDSDKERAYLALYRFEQTKRITRALAQATAVKNNAGHLKWVKRRLDRLRKRTASEINAPEAEDFLFELEIAGRLAMWSAHEVSLEEPDIVISVGDARMGLACKRPRTLKSMRRAILKAGEQLSGRPGFIIVGTEYLLHGTDDQGRQASIVEVLTEAEAVTEGERVLQNAEEAARVEIDRVFSAGEIGGILLCGCLVYVTTRPPTIYAYRWLWRRVPNRRLELAPELLEFLTKCLFESYPTPEELQALLERSEMSTE